VMRVPDTAANAVPGTTTRPAAPASPPPGHAAHPR
jgi:hypothetical protein